MENGQATFCTPPDWVLANVCDVSNLVRGVTYKKHQASNERGPDLCPLLRSNNINGSLNLKDDLVFVPKIVIADDQFLRVNDVVFAMSSGSKRLVGKNARFNSTVYRGGFGAFCGALRPYEGINAAFFALWFQSPWYRKHIFAISSGTNINNLKREHLLDFGFPFPPLVEQRAIVAKIEALFSELDKGVEQLQAVRQQLKRYRQSVLKAAFEGKLTAEWRAEQQAAGTLPSADDLLDQIKTEREARYQQQLTDWQQTVKDWESAGGKASDRNKPRKPARLKDLQPLTTHELANLPHLPDGWLWLKTGTLLLENSCSGISVKGSDSPPGVAALKLNAIGPQGFDYSLIRYIPIDKTVAEKLRIATGDFFVSRGNGSLDLVGRGTLAQRPTGPVVFPDTMIRLRLFLPLQDWLAWYWESRQLRGQIESSAKTTAGIYKINQQDIGSYVVPVASLSEQKLIIQALESRFSVLDELEKAVDVGLEQARALRQSILKKAFEGRLLSETELAVVRADPDYEPAEKLLERIHAEQGGERKRAESPRVIRLPKGERYRQAAFAAYAVNRLADRPTFGRTQLMKIEYLLPHLLARESHIHAEREAAGPWDRAIHKIEALAKKEGWFTVSKSGKRYKYRPGGKIAEACRFAEKKFGKKAERVDWLLDQFARMDTEQAELLATTFAVWNDHLIDGHEPTEEEIVNGVHGWHPDKAAKFPPKRIRGCIDWMKKNDLAPTGLGPKTEIVVGAA